jgi:hypothetical protein
VCSDRGGPEVPNTTGNLATVLYLKGDLAGAEKTGRDAVALDRAAHGPRHPYLAIGLCTLAQIMEAQGKYDEAEPLLRESRAIRREVLPADHPLLIDNLQNLALCIRSRGPDNTPSAGADEPEALLQEALRLALAKSPPDGARIAAIRAALDSRRPPP